ncbi:MAG: SxtJ family membrane protein [Gemmatimonadota bacterium]
MDERAPARLTASEGRRFGLTVGGAFLALGALLSWRGHATAAAALAAMGGLLVVGGLALPRRLGPVNRAWMGLAAILSRVTTPLAMAIVYFAIVTPIGLTRRLIGRDPLTRSRGATSFWVVRPPGSGRTSDLKRQF